MITKNHYILNQNEKDQISEFGITEEKIYEQLNIFNNGTSFSNIVKAATLTDGIISIKDFTKDELLSLKEKFNTAKSSGRLTKFVPASGAATRMFKVLLSFLNSSSDSNDKEISLTLKNLSKFAFYKDLSSILKNNSLDIELLIKRNDYKTILLYLLTEKGLNYSNLPKAFLKFHQYNNQNDDIRTSIEEQFLEGIEYVKDENGRVRLHFTVSVDIEDIESKERKLIDSLVGKYEEKGVKFILNFSKQKLSTNTIAVDKENNPFKNDSTEKLVLRAGGHGALIENLNDLIDADIVFIKNIDNVVVDRFKDTTYEFKEIMGGILLSLQEQVFEYLEILSTSNETNLVSDSKIEEIIEFMNKKLNISLLNIKNFSSKTKLEKINTVFEKLNRPIRVCGMVKNQGEPGGGPYWVKSNNNDDISLQIVEKAQIDLNNNALAKTELEKATHFNPVDIVFSMRDYENDKFNLLNFIDKDTYFISEKSINGKKLKALELPGLWNGAMADWTTIFLEVPLITFNPVKTVNDLLRKEHQNTITN